MCKIVCYVGIILLAFSCSIYIKTNKSDEKGMKYSLSSRSFHPINNHDPQSTMDVIYKLNPKRIDWTYTKKHSFLEIYQKMNLPYSLTINPQVPDSLAYTTKKYRIIDYRGEAYTAPWMKNWKQKNPYWGCVNNPLFYQLFLEQGIYLASLKPYAIMVDDAMFNARLKWEEKVGCFCTHCELNYENYNTKNYKTADGVRNLKKALRKNTMQKELVQNKNIQIAIQDYIEFQEKSVLEFLTKWKEEIRKKYPQLIFLTNNFNGNWNEIYQVFDGGIAELNKKYVNNKDLDSLYGLADSLQKTQQFSVASENEKIHFKLMEYNAKNNRETLLPWDINIVSKNKRYYMPLDVMQKKIKKLNKKYLD